MKKPLVFCANGDGNKVSPPSWVLCKECKDGVRKNLEKMLEDMEGEKVEAAKKPRD